MKRRFVKKVLGSRGMTESSPHMFPKWGNTHHYGYVFPGRRTYITRDRCFAGRVHISLGICVSQVGERISLRICVSQVGEHISLGICISQAAEQLSLGILVSQVGKHISPGIRISQVGEHI